MKSKLEKDFGIYLHVPWCRRRCSYCDFYFEIQQKAHESYHEFIIDELLARKNEYSERILNTLYFGGGTPSLLPMEQIQTIIDKISESYDFAKDIEITLEANPEDLMNIDPIALQATGINRLSIGIQSFDDFILKQLGRFHTGEEAQSILKKFTQYFNCSVDLIIGVPDESAKRLHRDIDIAVHAGAKHLSTYMLTVEEGTPLKKLITLKKRKDIDDDAQATAYEQTQAHLKKFNFRQYEISSFSLPGFESHHNRIYWGKGEYLGLGPGAHSMKLLENGEVYRRHNVSKWQDYSKESKNCEHETETLNQNAAFKEAVAFAIRDLLSGANLSLLSQKHQVLSDEMHSIQKVLDFSVDDGHLILQNKYYRLTAKGTLFADAIARQILNS